MEIICNLSCSFVQVRLPSMNYDLLPFTAYYNINHSAEFLNYFPPKTWCEFFGYLVGASLDHRDFGHLTLHQKMNEEKLINNISSVVSVGKRKKKKITCNNNKMKMEKFPKRTMKFGVTKKTTNSGIILFLCATTQTHLINGAGFIGFS